MPRIIIKTAKGPYEMKQSEKSTSICMCGLSKNQPICDTSHKVTLDEKEDEIYEYDEKGARIECGKRQNGGCCGGGCCDEK